MLLGGEIVAKILNVTANNDYTLLVRLDNGHSIVYDMRPRIQTTRFCILADICLFKAVRVEQENTLVWSTLCQMTIDEIMDKIDR